MSEGCRMMYGVPGILLGQHGKAALLSVAMLGLLSACGKRTSEDQLQQVLKQASSPNSMWFRLAFRAEYEGKPVKFDQYVYCGYARTPYMSAQGGTASPARPITKRLQPETIAKTMDDGSQLLLRVPDVCDWHRSNEHKARKGQPQDPFGRPHWLSLGSFKVLPLVVWSDKAPVGNDNSTQPERVELYVGQGYYKNASARLKKPSGSVTFMKAGFIPQNFEKIITQKRVFPSLRYQTTNIYTKKKEYSDWISGMHPEFEAYYILPMSNVKAYYEKNKNFGRLDQDAYGTKRWVDLAPEEPKEIIDQKSEFFSFYEYDEDFEKHGDPIDPTYLSPRRAQNCLWQMVSEGDPSYTNIPDITEDIRFRNQWFAGETYVGEDFEHKREREDQNNRIIARRESCLKNLDNVRSFDVINGRLDPSSSLPGMIVFHRWKRVDPNSDTNFYNGVKYGYRFFPEFLMKNGVVKNHDIKKLKYQYRFNQIEFENEYLDQILMEDKNNNWYILRTSGWPLSFYLSEEEKISEFYYSRDCCSKTDK